MLSCIILAGSVFFTDGRAMAPFDAAEQILVDKFDRLLVRSYGATWSFDIPEGDTDRPVYAIVKDCIDNAEDLDG
jgi:hypothetical protein